MPINEEEILQLKEDLVYMKDQHLKLAKIYGSELSAGNMERDEKELEKKISLLEKDLIIKKYLLSGGQLFVVKDIVKYRSCGTIEIITTKGNYYADKEVTNISTKILDEDTIVTDELLKFYLIDRIESYLHDLEEKAKGIQFFLSRMKY